MPPRGRRTAPVQRRKPATPAPPPKNSPSERDVTQYATKPATGYHKAFARWIVTEVGYSPDDAASYRAAFLAGVSIATAARPAFNASEAYEEWRERSGEAKRGPKRKETATRGKHQEPTDETDDTEFEDDEFEDEFDDGTDSESESDDEDNGDDVDDEFEDEPPLAPYRSVEPLHSNEVSPPDVGNRVAELPRQTMPIIFSKP